MAARPSLVLLALALITIMDMSASRGSGGAEASKEIPAPRYAQMMAGPSMKFLYW